MVSISDINKRIKSNSRWYWTAREIYVILACKIHSLFDRPKHPNKKRILFYHADSLSFGGTEKFLQIIAKHIDKKKYDVFFMYPDTVNENNSRFIYVESGGARMIPFAYSSVNKTPPYFIKGMNPGIKDLIASLHIDVFVIPGSGHADYPFSLIKNVPIILLNIFGQPNIQKNIFKHVCISKEVAQKLVPIVPENRIAVLPIPSEGPIAGSTEKGLALRRSLGIKDTDIVFGRIGRPDNGIFDPIGIEAFKKVLKTRSDVYYVIMSPAPVLRDKVEKENISNVYFIEPSSKEEDIWAFHASIDALAHFRLDGESFGLNIAEAMLSAKPVITHKSHIWNAHLEYLDESFCRVAERGDVDGYANFMLEFADKSKTGELVEMGRRAKAKADKLFLIQNNIGIFENFIDESIK